MSTPWGWRFFSRFFTEITKILALNVLTSTWVIVVFQARPILWWFKLFSHWRGPEYYYISLPKCDGGQTGRFYQFLACTLWQVNTKRKMVQNCCFLWPQSPQRHRLFTGADGTDVPSLLTQQARAIPPLLELCAPSHRNNTWSLQGRPPSTTSRLQ